MLRCFLDKTIKQGKPKFKMMGNSLNVLATQIKFSATQKIDNSNITEFIYANTS